MLVDFGVAIIAALVSHVRNGRGRQSYFKAVCDIDRYPEVVFTPLGMPLKCCRIDGAPPSIGLEKGRPWGS